MWEARARVVDAEEIDQPACDDTAEGAFTAREFAEYVGIYRNGIFTMQIIERDGKLIFRSMDLPDGCPKGEWLDLSKDGAGWLTAKTADGVSEVHIFAVPAAGPRHRIEFLLIGDRVAARAA
jgi:hypothetical protein